MKRIPCRFLGCTDHGLNLVQRRSTKSTTPSIFFRFSSSSTGFKTGCLYQQYLEARQHLEDMKREQEQQKSKDMFETWQRSKEQASNPKVTGVAVVKTLAKHARQETNYSEQLEHQVEQLLKEAAIEQKHPQALVEYANELLAKKPYDTETINKCLEYYRISDSAEGWFNVGHLLWTGIPDQSSSANDATDNIALPRDPTEAMAAFRHAINLGDADSMYFCGVNALSLEENGDISLQQGLEWINRAAEIGHGGALYYLALLHLNGDERLNVPPCSEEEFVRRLNAAVDAECADAAYLRGHSYYNGESGYPKDLTRALNDFERAAEWGNSDAAVSIGAIYYSKQEYAKAFEWYQRAGEMGSLEGWRNVVSCYLSGTGVPQSIETAKYIANTMLSSDKK